MSGANARTVVVTGATGGAGVAAVRRLLAAGATVIAAGRSQDRLRALIEGSTDDAADNPVPTALWGDVIDLADEAATRAWAEQVRELRGPVDGVIHLVGGWRGGARFPDNTMADAAWLHEQIVITTQHVTLAFYDDLVASPAGRFAIVSALAASDPTAGNSAYASAKAAAETWTRALAHAFATEQAEPGPLRAAATIFVVGMLIEPEMRAEQPGRLPPGATDVDELADAVVGLWDTDPVVLNGARVMLGS